MSRDRLLEKLAKLRKAAAGEAEVGNTEAAAAFAAKFQQMLLDHDISMTDVEFASEQREQPVGEHCIDYTQYPDIKLKKARVQWMEDLAYTVAKAHFCDILVHSGSSRITLVGTKDHCAVAEYMIMTLTRMADRLADREYAAFSTACVKECALCGHQKATCECASFGEEFTPNWAKARGFRPSFLMAFITTLSARYRRERTQATTSSSTALVRVNTMELAIKDYLTSIKIKNASQLNDNSAHNRHGIRRGKELAEQVGLNANAMGAAPQKAIK